MGIESDGPAFQVNKESATENEEELVLSVMLVPMKLPVQHTQSHDRVVHPAEGLVRPFLFGGGNKHWHVDQLQTAELDVEVDVVVPFVCHGAYPFIRKPQRPR